ncbi:MAG TPA: AAA family ATPase [Candidatus Aminicenantes bacterium]|nr:AAA family ATPase [Candidatus Aminicenantes bacterium]
MILRSIEVSGWRSFLEATSVGSFSDRLNVIHGPNGIGKSTLFEALRRALMDSHSVTGQDISDIRPWGRALSPRVVVEFLHGGAEYRLTKRFLEGKSSALERKEGRAYRPLAENKAADDFVRELLSRESPGRGLSQQKHWGLAQVLWAPQGELGLDVLSGDLLEDIHAVLGAQVTDKVAGPIEERIWAMYSTFFTPQKKVKLGKNAPPIAAMEAERERTKQELAEALDLLARSEAASRKVEDLAARHRQLEIDREELDRLVAETRKNVERYKELKAAESIKRSESERAEAQYRELKGRIELIEKTKGRLDDLRKSKAKIEDELPLRKREAADTAKTAAEAKASLEESRKAAESTDRAEKAATDAKRFVDGRAELRALRERIRKIEAAEARLAELEKRRLSLVTPDSKTFKQLRKLFEEKERCQELMEAAMLRLEVEPETDVDLEVAKAEKPGKVHVSKGSSAEIKGSPEILAVIHGIARLRISGPTVGADEHRSALNKAAAKITDIARPFGTTDLDTLEDLFEKGSQLDGKIHDVRKEIETLCSEADKAVHQQEAARLEALMAEIEKEYPAWAKSAPDPDILKREASEAKREQTLRIKDAVSNWGNAEKAATAAGGIYESALHRLEESTKEIKKVEQELAEANSDGKAMEALKEELTRLALTWYASKEALKDARDKLDRFGGDPGEALQRHEKSLDALRASLQKVRDDQRIAVGGLNELVSSGPFTQSALAEEKLLILEEAISKENLKMESAKLLYETVSGLKSESLAAVARPVEDTAARLMHRIAGRRIGAVVMGDSFVPSQVSPESAESPVGIENLSGGEREQLYLATRLALADVLAKNERQLVVLDDVLTATDMGRFARILSILEEAADRLQILILTCHPERYRTLEEARFFDLEALIAGAAGS